MPQNMPRRSEDLHLSYEQVKPNAAGVVHLGGQLTPSSWSGKPTPGSTLPTISQLEQAHRGQCPHFTHPMSPTPSTPRWPSPNPGISFLPREKVGLPSFLQLGPGLPELLPHFSSHLSCQEKDVEFPTLRCSLGPAGLFNSVSLVVPPT